MSASELKDQGNALFSAGDFPGAIAKFSAAIAADPANHVLYSNRSAAKVGTKDYAGAKEDALKTIELKKDWAKGYSRLATAQIWLGEFEEANETIDKGLALDPANTGLLEARKELEMKEAEELGGMGGAGGAGLGAMFNAPDVWTKLGNHPSTRAFLADQNFVQTVKLIQQNPMLVGSLVKDPRIMQAVGVLLGIDLTAMGGAGGAGGAGPMDTDDAPAPAPAKPAPAASSASSASSAAAAAAKKAPEPVVEEDESDLTEEEKAARKKKKDALAEKEKGNDAYKKKDFDLATKHYKAAIELDPEEMSFYSNLAAVDLEAGRFQECVNNCQLAIEKGRAVRADFTLIGRAFDRMGKAYLKLDLLGEAIEAFKKSLSENRTADVLTRLRETEKLKKERDEKAYINPELSAKAKDLGNDAFKNNDYAGALKHYEEAIRRNPTDAKLYSNKAACYQKLGALPEVIRECDQAIALDKNFGKAYSRKGAAQFLMKEYHKCLETYQAGLAVDPSSEELKEGLQRTMAAINMGSNDDDETRAARAMQDPEIQQILSDPAMRLILESMNTDPGAFGDHMKNPVVAAKIRKLIAAGVLKVK